MHFDHIIAAINASLQAKDNPCARPLVARVAGLHIKRTSEARQVLDRQGWLTGDDDLDRDFLEAFDHLLQLWGLNLEAYALPHLAA